MLISILLAALTVVPYVEDSVDAITFVQVDHQKRIYFWIANKPLAYEEIQNGEPPILLDEDNESMFVTWLDHTGVYIKKKGSNDGRFEYMDVMRKVRTKQVFFSSMSRKLNKLDWLLGVERIDMLWPSIEFGKSLTVPVVEE